MLLIFLIAWGTNFDYLNVGTGARPSALGNAFCALYDVNSVIFNPSALTQLYHGEILYMHTELPAQTKYDYIAICKRFRNIPMGFGLIRVSTEWQQTTSGDTLPGTNYPEIVYLGTAKFLTEEYNLSIGHKIKDFSAGITLKFYRMELHRSKGFGAGFNFGIFYSAPKIHLPASALRIYTGIRISDIFTRIKWNTGYTDKLKPSADVGLALSYWKGYDVLILSLQTSRILSSGYPFTFHTGIEWSMIKEAKLRFGLDNGKFTCGLGLNYRNFGINYAYSTHPELKNTHKLDFSFKFK